MRIAYDDEIAYRRRLSSCPVGFEEMVRSFSAEERAKGRVHVMPDPYHVPAGFATTAALSE